VKKEDVAIERPAISNGVVEAGQRNTRFSLALTRSPVGLKI
jgi:hypothetical protein